MSTSFALTAVRDRREHALAIVCFASICLIWGTTFLAIRVAIETIPTLWVTGLRFTIADVILLVIAVARGHPLPRRATQWGHEALTGVLLVPVANGAVVWATHSITSGLAALLAATLPLWMAVLERVIPPRASLPRGRVAGLVLGFCGVAAVLAPAIVAPSTGLGLLLGTLGMQFYAVAWNLGTMRTKRNPSGVSPAVAPALQLLLGGVFTLIAARLVGPLDWAAVGVRGAVSLGYLALFGSVIAYSAYHYALRVMPLGRLTLYAYVQPVVAAVAGAFVLDERITLPMVAGMILIFGGMTLARKGERPSTRELRAR